MSDEEKHITTCYQLAELSVKRGNHPFGALLVIDDQEVARAENTVLTDRDVTRHAELNLVGTVTRNFDPAQLQRAILYTSTEPCAMCSGAIYWSGIRHIVYGCSASALGEIAGATFIVPCRELLAYGCEPSTITGPILPLKGAAIHRNFWPTALNSPSDRISDK